MSWQPNCMRVAEFQSASTVTKNPKGKPSKRSHSSRAPLDESNSADGEFCGSDLHRPRQTPSLALVSTMDVKVKHGKQSHAMTLDTTAPNWSSFCEQLSGAPSKN